jgi:hypothetical protein
VGGITTTVAKEVPSSPPSPRWQVVPSHLRDFQWVRIRWSSVLDPPSAQKTKPNGSPRSSDSMWSEENYGRAELLIARKRKLYQVETLSSNIERAKLRLEIETARRTSSLLQVILEI